MGWQKTKRESSAEDSLRRMLLGYFYPMRCVVAYWILRKGDDTS